MNEIICRRCGADSERDEHEGNPVLRCSECQAILVRLPDGDLA